MYLKFVYVTHLLKCPVSVQKADLASVLDLLGPITVFAPDSSAFDAMTEGHLQYLSSAEVRTTQHVSAISCFQSIRQKHFYPQPSGSHQIGGAAQEPHCSVHRGQYNSRPHV